MKFNITSTAIRLYKFSKACYLVVILFLSSAIHVKVYAQSHCINREPVSDLIKLGIYAEVEEIITEYYTTECRNGKWIADSLMYTRVSSFNNSGFYTQIIELHPDLQIFGWKYSYQNGQLVSIVGDRNGYKTDMQTIRWVNDNYYISYLFPFDVRQNIFRVKPESSAGHYLNSAGREIYSFLGAADTCNKWLETRYVYERDTIKMYTFDFRSSKQILHTTLILDKDDCDNPLQVIRDRETTPIIEFNRYRYFSK